MLDAKNKKALAAAIAGDLDTIRTLFRSKSRTDMESKADEYRWLMLAADHDHDGAEAAAKKLLAEKPLRDDPENAGIAHLCLGEWYLTAKNGFPLDFALARKHFGRAKEMVDFDLVVDYLRTTRRKLKPDAAAILDAFFPDEKKTKTR